MKNLNDSGPAFPMPLDDDRDCGPRYAAGYGGMSLRDWFAGQALAGMLANPETYTVSNEEIAISCGEIADAMLTERSQHEKPE